MLAKLLDPKIPLNPLLPKRGVGRFYEKLEVILR